MPRVHGNRLFHPFHRNLVALVCMPLHSFIKLIIHTAVGIDLEALTIPERVYLDSHTHDFGKPSFSIFIRLRLLSSTNLRSPPQNATLYTCSPTHSYTMRWYGGLMLLCNICPLLNSSHSVLSWTKKDKCIKYFQLLSEVSLDFDQPRSGDTAHPSIASWRKRMSRFFL